MRTAAYISKRGDVVWLEFASQAGHEQAGRRPALVISPLSYNRAAKLALVCPITNQVKGYTFEVVLPAGLSVTGAVLADQVKNVDYTVRNARYITLLPNDTVQEVIKKASTLLK